MTHPEGPSALLAPVAATHGALAPGQGAADACDRREATNTVSPVKTAANARCDAV